MAEVEFSIESQKAKLKFEPLHNTEGSWKGHNICRVKLFKCNDFRRNTWSIKLCKSF